MSEMNAKPWELFDPLVPQMTERKWKKWRKPGLKCQLHEAIALSLNIDPDSIVVGTSGPRLIGTDGLVIAFPDVFWERLKIATEALARGEF